MKQRIWFRAKDYGYGWYPSAWQGWVILLVFVVLLILNVVRISVTPSLYDLVVWYLPETIILVGVLIFICYLTGEKPEWRWGGKPVIKKKKEDQ
jgi:uncharacterized membrane protein YhaH (DUF805 family)